MNAVSHKILRYEGCFTVLIVSTKVNTVSSLGLQTQDSNHNFIPNVQRIKYKP